MKTKTSKIIISIISVLVVAGLGSLFVNLGMDWFNSLAKPSQWIYNFIIPIMWTIIYLATCVVLYLWISNGDISTKVAVLFVINGILNVLWCLIFFTMHLTFLGNVVIVANTIFAVVLLYQIFKYNEFYGYLLSIYPIWLCLATTLNLACWILN
ncbi:MAG: tryptophan-rich sensory protein [Clostridia bacterium]|nr:tryptophan-rich sensory protein [Clostridia bacterium]